MGLLNCSDLFGGKFGFEEVFMSFFQDRQRDRVDDQSSREAVTSGLTARCLDANAILVGEKCQLVYVLARPDLAAQGGKALGERIDDLVVATLGSRIRPLEAVFVSVPSKGELLQGSSHADFKRPGEAFHMTLLFQRERVEQSSRVLCREQERSERSRAGRLGSSCQSFGLIALQLGDE